ncbi:MAG: hypothetical protein ACFFAS_11680 [Promethearchaeota archaeon]
MVQKSKNFSDHIKELEKELHNSSNSIVSVNTKYRASQDKIDKLNKILKEERKEIQILVRSINELCNKFDEPLFIINSEDLKVLNNAETMILINNAIRAIANKK